MFSFWLYISLFKLSLKEGNMQVESRTQTREARMHTHTRIKWTLTDCVVTSKCCRKAKGCWGPQSATPGRTRTWCRRVHGWSTLGAPAGEMTCRKRRKSKKHSYRRRCLRCCWLFPKANTSTHYIYSNIRTAWVKPLLAVGLQLPRYHIQAYRCNKTPQVSSLAFKSVAQHIFSKFVNLQAFQTAERPSVDYRELILTMGSIQ